MTFSEKNGFTLIEFLITIGIIALLTTISIASVSFARSRASTTKAEADLATIRKAIDALAGDTKHWPGHQIIDNVCTTNITGPPGCDTGNNELCDDGCASTLSSGFGGITQTDGNFPGWNGPYMNSIPLDPWGNEYFLDTDYNTGSGTEAVIGSYGPNGSGLNLYDSDDIFLIISL